MKLFAVLPLAAIADYACEYETSAIVKIFLINPLCMNNRFLSH